MHRKQQQPSLPASQLGSARTFHGRRKKSREDFRRRTIDGAAAAAAVVGFGRLAFLMVFKENEE